MQYFQHLNHAGKLDATWDHGVRIGERRDKEYKMVLYQLSAFYVEYFFCVKKHSLVRIESFDNTDQLAPYTSSIKLEF